MLYTEDLFDINKLDEELRKLLTPRLPWEILANIDDFVKQIDDDRRGFVHETAVLEGDIHLAASAHVGPHVYIQGPAWIAEGVKIKHGAYLRAGVILASGAEVGAKTEVKRSLFLNNAKAAHLNYVGDSVLGYKVNLGAGVKLANFKTFGSNISVEGQETGLRKFGAILGDEVSLGCNAVSVPGTIVGQRTIVYNLAMLRGVVAADKVVKLRQQLEFVDRE